MPTPPAGAESTAFFAALYGAGAPAAGLLFGGEQRATVRGGVTLTYELLGEGGGPPGVVVTPGMMRPRAAARATASALARATGQRVLIWDRRSSGGSTPFPPAAAAVSVEEAADLAALLDHLGASSVVLFGVSNGARLSVLFAAAHPARVRALVLAPPTGDAGGAAAKLAKSYFADHAALAEAGGMRAVVASAGHFGQLAAQRPDARAALLAADPAAFAAAMRRSAAFIRQFAGQCCIGVTDAALRGIQAPALVLHHGDAADRSHAIEDARAVARALPHARLVVDADVAEWWRAAAAFIRGAGAAARL